VGSADQNGKDELKQETSISRHKRQAREMAVKLLYEIELAGLTRREVEERVGRKLRRAEVRDFTLALVNQTLENLAEIDKIIAGVAENWDISRMAVLDRTILRLGVAEILFSEVPDKVAMNEAIEIAKRFSTDNSGRFVNGILDKVARMKGDLRSNI
jgi:transcription antitermination factor NusB